MQKKKESESQAAATSALKNSQTKAKPRQVAVTSKRNHSGANQEVVSGGGVVGGGLQTDRTAHSKEQSGGLRPIWGSDFDQTRFNWLGGSQSETAGVELR